jgi:hypothetical protein
MKVSGGGSWSSNNTFVSAQMETRSLLDRVHHLFSFVYPASCELELLLSQSQTMALFWVHMLSISVFHHASLAAI